MCEVLVVANDRPVPEGPGRWKRGQIVVVRGDGWEWGNKEGPPKFFVVKLPGVDVSQVRDWEQEWVTATLEADPDDPLLIRPRLTKHANRRKFIDLAAMTGRLRQKALSNGVLMVETSRQTVGDKDEDWTTFRQFVKDVSKGGLPETRDL